MKKIAFFVQLMLCGGVENALISLTNKLSNDGNDVTIYVVKKSGDFINKVPPKVRLVSIPMKEKIRRDIPIGGTKICVYECIKKKQYIQAGKYLFSRILKRSEFAELNVDFSKIPALKEHYDIAVNYHIHSPFLVKYLSEKVDASKKYTWIHNDFITTGYDIKKLKEYLDVNDAFFCVSQKLVKEFKGIFSEYINKIFVAYNIIPEKDIIKKAEEFIPEEYKNLKANVLKLLTVGRLEEQKGFDLAIKSCKLLKEKNKEINFQWFVLGDGTQKDILKKMIVEAGINDVMHLLGIKENPYPYFKNCDIYIQTSRHEGMVTTISEAKIFCKPIIATDFAGIREQIEDGISGDIVEIDVFAIYKKLVSLIKEDRRRKQYSTALKERKITGCYEWLNIFY